MKKHIHDPRSESGNIWSLANAIAQLETTDSVQAFLEDLCTPSELEAMADRWRVVPLLERGIPYREIYDETGVSITTVGRVARTLERGAGGYSQALAHQALEQVEKE